MDFIFSYCINDVNQTIVNQMFEILWVAPKTFLGKDQFSFGDDQNILITLLSD
jgi:hypothetical protein